MPAKEVLLIDGYSQDLLISVENKTVTIQNTETDATHFCFNIGAADWEEIKHFVDKKINQ